MAAAQNGVPIEYEQVDVKPQLNGVHLPNGRPHHPQPPPQPKTHPETEHNFRQDGRFRRILIFFARIFLINPILPS